MPRSSLFPPPTESSPDGLVAVGGDLSPERLLDAYRCGIFPWPVSDEDPMPWWSPNPRAILPLDGLHISRRLRRTLRAGKFQVTCDQAFRDVLHGCASAQDRLRETWLSEEMIGGYVEMHRLGHRWALCRGEYVLPGTRRFENCVSVSPIASQLARLHTPRRAAVDIAYGKNGSR